MIADAVDGVSLRAGERSLPKSATILNTAPQTTNKNDCQKTKSDLGAVF